MPFQFPTAERFAAWSDAETGDLPRFARATKHRDQPAIDDVAAATRAALADLDLDSLSPGASVAITAGSRGIRDLPAVLSATVAALQDRGLDPFVMAAMGSHGGATAEGQAEVLASLGITEEWLGCPIRSSMAVETVGTDADGRPVHAAEDALAADAVVLVNRVKAHTDYNGDYESGLAKMAVVGLGKHRGAETMHNAALARGFQSVIPERARVLFAETPVIGGVAIVENADERAAIVEGVPVEEILDREPELLARSKELLATLPVSDLDMLVLDGIGKEVSGTGMDTNVVGRVRFHGQPDPDEPAITRIYVRSLTEGSHGNALGMGLADFVHQRVVRAVDLADTYVNVATSGEPGRAKLPFVVPTDEAALLMAASTTGRQHPGDLRIARIRNTLDPDELLVSEPVAEDLRDDPTVTVGDPEPLAFDADGEFSRTL
ncbi:DUF362 domain-containing protein [Halobacteriales archaeon QS_1_68_17]|nr:MAG: DUF362 domain-containing protein [Halobacteriales archaeon QS_1_68_17]